MHNMCTFKPLWSDEKLKDKMVLIDILWIGYPQALIQTHVPAKIVALLLLEGFQVWFVQLQAKQPYTCCSFVPQCIQYMTGPVFLAALQSKRITSKSKQAAFPDYLS